MMLQDVCIIGMASRKIVYTISGPRIARTEELSDVSFRHLICLMVKRLY